jgi:predicted nuclease of predicted toxin-antitoxin system
MLLWLDAQLSPQLASWINSTFSEFVCKAIKELQLRDAADKDIFFAAKEARAIVITKDSDFINLLHRYKSPPKIIWLTCGNTSNEFLQQLLSRELHRALEFLEENDLVEITS